MKISQWGWWPSLTVRATEHGTTSQNPCLDSLLLFEMPAELDNNIQKTVQMFCIL